ncbi:MAG: mechanosensitive ion channel [Gammaproteobacteria bacterium]|nr:mechanosensitive ion channel [Gammaproteobacteria bacterium]
MMRYLLAALLACLFAADVGAATNPSDAPQWLEPAQKDIQNIKRELRDFDVRTGDRRALQDWQKPIPDLKTKTQACIDQQGAERDRLNQDLKSITGEDAGSAAAGKQTRAEIKAQLTQTEKRLIGCQALMIEIASVDQKLKRLQTEMLSGFLLSREAGLWSTAIQSLSSPLDWAERGQVYLESRLQIVLMSAQRSIRLVVAVLISWVTGYYVGQRLQAIAKKTAGDDMTARLYRAVCYRLGRRISLLFVLGAIAGVLYFDNPSGHLPLTVSAILGIMAYMIASAAARILLHPRHEQDYILTLPYDKATALYRRLQFLLVLGLVWGVSWISDAEEVFMDYQWGVIRSVFLTLAIVNLLGLLFFLRRASGLLGNPLLRLLAALVLAAALVADYIGYRNLATFIVSGLLLTALLAIGIWIVNALFQDLFDGLDDGRYAWQAKVRERLGLAKDEHVPGLIWLRLIVAVVAWAVFGVALVNVWGYTNQGWLWLYQFTTRGFEIGSLHIMPLQWAFGLAVFALLLTLVRWLRQDVLQRWIGRSRLDRGAREAVITIAGYVGVMISALVGLSLAGFNFTNLAIIAGALSVGIGFGLQNIVNNFVSGIILLFERPIRTGDWIVVGETEGYVRRISIRSTQIETFDRMDVIVPNSDLIASQVKNWMLTNPWGRVRVPVGVAYGSDVEKVKEILLAVANAHPLVMTDGIRVSEPVVLFQAFGESSLDFELRCFIRDVEKRLHVTSDLNFAIDAAFRKAGVEIPFPQRDLHLRSVDPGIRFERP